MILHCIDLEMNKPSGSIVEIGGVKLNTRTGVTFDHFQTHVDPYEPIDPYITALTGITDADVKKAPDLIAALDLFWRWVGSETRSSAALGAWGSDGDDIRFHTDDHLLPRPKRLHLINIKHTANLLRSAYPAQKDSAGLKSTMELFGMKFDGDQHRAQVDAFNTARLAYRFVKMIRGCLAAVDALD